MIISEVGTRFIDSSVAYFASEYRKLSNELFRWTKMVASTTKKGIRLRKKPREEGQDEDALVSQTKKSDVPAVDTPTTASDIWNILRFGWFIIGVTLAFYSGVWFYR